MPTPAQPPDAGGLMSLQAFKNSTDAGRFAQRSDTIHKIDDLLERYPRMTNFLKALAAYKIYEYCVDYEEQLKRENRASKRLGGVMTLRKQALAEHGKLRKLARAQNNFRKLIHNPKFKKLGQVTVRTDPSAKQLEDGEVLEALDDLHRAGHGLKKIHDIWKCSATTQNFWDFLEHHLRSNPDDEPYRVKYLNENERRAYEVDIRGGQLMQGEGNQRAPFDTTRMAVNSPRPENVWGWAIFVASMERRLYSGGSFSSPATKASGHLDVLNSGHIFHHSSFLEGRPVMCAGEWLVERGKIVCVTPRSGHYQPPVKLFKNFLLVLRSKGVLLDRIVVAWPWPNYNDRRYYNAQEFFAANQVAFKSQPFHNGVALRELTDMRQPLSYQQPVPQNVVAQAPQRSERPVPPPRPPRAGQPLAPVAPLNQPRPTYANQPQGSGQNQNTPPDRNANSPRRWGTVQPPDRLGRRT